MRDTYPIANNCFWRRGLRCVLACALTLPVLSCGKTAWGQVGEAKDARVMTIRGRVLNQQTKEPVGRALVTITGDVYATMTDDRGQFELRIVEQRPKEPGQGNVAGGRAIIQFGLRVSLQARKPGFLLPKPSLAKIVKEGLEEAAIFLLSVVLVVVRASRSEGA